MNRYAIITDSGADLTQALVEELDVEVIPLTLTMEGKTYADYPDRRELPVKTMYDCLRAGQVATTAAINVQECRQAFLPFLKEGRDVLAIAFSSGLSSTCQSYVLAALELSQEFPDRKILVVDSLCASLGQGLLVFHAARKRDQGASIEECRDYVESIKLNLCHWFTVDDLHFLKRGGRVSAATALLGSMLSIKPDMHVDNAGHLINVGKSRGRMKSIQAIVDHAAELAVDPGEQTMFICHGDCPEDAETLADLVRQRFGTKDIRIGYTGPVIGAHSGPGTLALFFLGTQR